MRPAGIGRAEAPMAVQHRVDADFDIQMLLSDCHAQQRDPNAQPMGDMLDPLVAAPLSKLLF